MKEYRWETRMGIFDIRTLVLVVTDSIPLTMEGGFPDYCEEYGRDFGDNIRAHAFEHNKQCVIVLSRNGGLNTRTIAHEALHVATGLFVDMGIPISRDNDEILAYTQDWIIGTIENWLKEAGIRIKPFNYYNFPAKKLRIRNL